MTVNVTIGQYVAACRRSAGLTQIHLAEILGVARTTIGRWERDEIEPSPPNLRLLIQRKIIDKLKLQELLLTGAGWAHHDNLISIIFPNEVIDEADSINLLHVQNGPFNKLYGDKQFVFNRVIPFSLAGTRGEMQATVRTILNEGFEFKCFIDHSHFNHREIKQQIENYGHHNVSSGDGGNRNRRTWFLLRNYEVVETPEGFKNNFYYPT